MARTFTVVTYANGERKEEQVPMSAEMERIVDEMKAFNAANPGFWCKCGKPETGEIVERGHSVDVFCRNCGGCLQVG
jgi:hypothetical protein